MKKIASFIMLLGLICFTYAELNANDCSNMEKKCKDPAPDFQISATSRSMKMRKGKRVRIVLNAYGGREYFFSTYSKAKVGALQFRIINSANNHVLYDNATEGLADSKIFKVESSQKLHIEVLAPNWRSNNLYECAGFKIAYKKIDLF
ncbi:hypothetical protein E9993_13205 [Labilibacter sediminis]|nr:hypothetical protein E9993_13205 [Labilibacter sediminis]